MELLFFQIYFTLFLKKKNKKEKKFPKSIFRHRKPSVKPLNKSLIRGESRVPCKSIPPHVSAFMANCFRRNKEQKRKVKRVGERGGEGDNEVPNNGPQGRTFFFAGPFNRAPSLTRSLAPRVPTREKRSRDRSTRKKN